MAKGLPVDLHARHAILVNADTGAILYEKQAHVPAFPASTTKIATALFVLDEKRVDLNQKVTVSPEAVRVKTAKNRNEAPSWWLESDATKMGLVRGETVTMEALLHGLMLVSGNDAANAIAEAVSGTVPSFMEELNHYLKQIGCQNTKFCNPHGYHDPDHVTTAYDLAVMARHAIHLPTFREIVSKQSYLNPPTNKHQMTELKQFNQLMVEGSKYFYSKAIGVKTGYHTPAGFVLVGAASHEGRTLVAVVLGGSKRHERYEDARNLFEIAFAEHPVQRLLVPATQTYNKALPGAKQPLIAVLTQDFNFSYYPAEEPEIKAFVQWENLSLPIKKGQKVGEVRAFDQYNNLLAKTDLYAREGVEQTLFFVLKEKWDKFFR